MKTTDDVHSEGFHPPLHQADGVTEHPSRANPTDHPSAPNGSAAATAAGASSTPLRNTPIDHLRDAVMIANALEHEIMEKSGSFLGGVTTDAARSLLADVRQLRDRVQKAIEGVERERIVVGLGDRL